VAARGKIIDQESEKAEKQEHFKRGKSRELIGSAVILEKKNQCAITIALQYYINIYLTSYAD
jgi:hypothetical protein